MRNRRLSWLSAPYVLWMALFVVIPLIVVVVYAFTKELAGGAWVPTLENFAGMAGYAAVFARSFLLGRHRHGNLHPDRLPAAYLLTRTPPGFRRVANMLICCPCGELPAAHLFLDDDFGRYRPHQHSAWILRHWPAAYD